MTEQEQAREQSAHPGHDDWHHHRRERRRDRDRSERPEQKNDAREAQPAKRDVPVPNDLPWYALSGTVLVGAALLSYGMVLTVRKMAKDLRASATREARVSVVATLVSIAVASGLGALVGYLTWHWALGLVSAIVGAWASPWVVDMVSSIASRWKK